MDLAARAAGWIAAAALVAACGGGDGADSGSTEAGSASGSSGATASATASGTSEGSTNPTSGPGGTDTTGTTSTPGTTDTTGGPTSTGDPTGGTTGGAMTVCEDNCHYVRAGAAGSGADWDDALPELPDSLERGHIYFVAAGTYPGYQFDDPGDALIRVLRATGGDHGTDVGWDPGHGEGEAVMGELSFSSGHYEVDGRGATRAVGSYQGTVVAIGAPAVTLRGFDVDGDFQQRGGQHTGGACTAMTIGADDVVVAGNRIHDAADDGVVAGGLANLSFTGNIVHALHGCGTDGDCGPCFNGHSDGLELYDVVDSEIVGNMIYDVASTAAVFFGNWADELGMGPSEYCENVLLANNILYSPDTGFVAYIEDAVGVTVLHNVMWGLHQGAYGGLSIGTNVADLDLYNNVILSINFDHIGGMFDPSEHHGDFNLFAYSLGQWQDGPNDIVAVDPGFAGVPGGEGPAVADPQPADFAPAAGSPMIDAGWPGDADIVLPATDFFGTPRDDTPNLGAIE